MAKLSPYYALAFFPRGSVLQEIPGWGLPAKKTAKEHKCDLAGFLCREAMFWQGHTLALQVKSN